MAQLPFKTVDVFTTVPFMGNPVAVVLDASGLSAAQMQQIARWTKLSETTFVIPKTAEAADYQVRIFTPGAELPFAGHPTIGTAHALLEAGMIEPRDGVLVQQCAAGLITLIVEPGSEGTRTISFDLPQPRLTVLTRQETEELSAILDRPLTAGRPPYLVDVGARWLVAQLSDAQTVLDTRPDLQRMRIQDSRRGITGVVIFGKHVPDVGAKIEVRAFAPAHGIDEDPVCGSGNGSVAAYIRHTGQTPEFGNDFIATEGAVLGRAGVLRLSIADELIRVGGSAVTCVDGQLSI